MKKEKIEQNVKFMNNDIEELKVEHKKYFLLKGVRENVEKKNLKSFEPGDVVWGECAEPIVLKEFSDLDEALEELGKYKCSVDEHIELCDIVEYAIEIQEIDEDGEIINADFELAEREEREMTNAEMVEKLEECKGMVFSELDEDLKKCIKERLVATDACTGCKPSESGECTGDIFDTLYSLTKCSYDAGTDEVEVADDAVLYDSIEGI